MNKLKYSTSMQLLSGIIFILLGKIFYNTCLGIPYCHFAFHMNHVPNPSFKSCWIIYYNNNYGRNAVLPTENSCNHNIPDEYRNSCSSNIILFIDETDNYTIR